MKPLSPTHPHPARVKTLSVLHMKGGEGGGGGGNWRVFGLRRKKIRVQGFRV